MKLNCVKTPKIKLNHLKTCKTETKLSCEKNVHQTFVTSIFVSISLIV